MGKLVNFSTAIVALVLVGCAHSPSPEEITATRARIDQECASRYRPNTEEFRLCVAQRRNTAFQGPGIGMGEQAALGAGLAGMLITGAMLSDERLKRDVEKIGAWRGFNLYRFRYLWSDEIHVGVMAQEVEAVRPDAVMRGKDGYLRVHYGRL